MIETIETGSAKVVGLKLCGKLHVADYQQFGPTIETLLTAAGKVRLFIQFEDFHGWDLHAAWDDLKFGLRHYADFERIAMVGDQRWERWMASFCKPFTQAKVKYFDHAEVDAAWNWLREDEQGSEGADGPARTADKRDLWESIPWSGF